MAPGALRRILSEGTLNDAPTWPDGRSGKAGALGSIAREASHGRHQDTGEQLHGSDITLIEGIGRSRQHFEDAERPAVLSQRRDQNRSSAETAATGEIDPGVFLGVVTEKNFAGADALRR